MLTRRAVLLSGAAAGAAPLFSPLSMFTQETPSLSKKKVMATQVTFSPVLANYVASSGAQLTKRLSSEGLSVPSLKGASSLLQMAANHTHQNSLDSIVKVILQKQPSLAEGKNIHAALVQGFQSYQQYDKQAKIPDLSRVLSMKSEDSAAALDHVSRIGITGVLRDLANTLGTAAHEKLALGLKQVSLETQEGPVISDGVWRVGQPLRLQHVQATCKSTAKTILCSQVAEGGIASTGLALAALALACAPFTLVAVNAALPPAGVALDAACAVLAVNPALAIQLVGGFIVAVIGFLQWLMC